jgi:hypothetical protein
VATDVSPETCRLLAEEFRKCELLRPMRVRRYDPGDVLTYEVTGVVPARSGRVQLEVEAFIGGGFAGQVYRVRALALDTPDGPIEGLTVGGVYAIKILRPPSARAQKFRDVLFALGFQAPFSLQGNPAAARAGALWQKFIRRAAAIRFGSERGVVDVLATFVDTTLGSCGEISEWVDGRTWRFEVDDRLDERRRRPAGSGGDGLGSPEYRAKKDFMAGMVRLMEEMGAAELARQYRWWTCKSQPNCLKRLDSDSDPAGGLTAVDFRPGLALLPVLPMSPADVALIFKGLGRGSLVQFDRGDVGRLQRFVEANDARFADMQAALEELKACERTYRDSMPDATHNHVRLLYSRRLWSTTLDAAVTGWEVRGLVDERRAAALRGSRIKTIVFAVLGLLSPLTRLAGLALLVAGAAVSIWGDPASPWRLTWAVVATGLGLLLAAPIVLRLLRTVWGRGDYRRHYARMLISPGYLGRALRGRVAEKLIVWHRAGRIAADRAVKLLRRSWRFLLELPLSLLPVVLHRMLTDRRYAVEKLKYVFVRPVRLYFNAEAREQWLRDMVAEGRRSGMLSDEDAGRILGRIKEPYIQKYLKALAVHVCTLPITQIVSVTVAVWYKIASNLTWAEAWDEMLLIIGVFQIVPISPGSLVRGLYVVYLAVRERNFRDYNIAVFMGFMKYIGYLAFPIQMAYKYPALARFMAAHWATGAVHFVPVFGERGALLEHAVFDRFYNYPLTVRRRIAERSRGRAGRKRRSWHVPLCAVAGAGVLTGMDLAGVRMTGHVPSPLSLWYVIWLPVVLAGAAAAAFAGGAPAGKRILFGCLCGILTGVLYGASHTGWSYHVVSAGSNAADIRALLRHGVSVLAWAAFLFALGGTFGAAVVETRPVR